ncbi:sensor histidine kinase [Chthoniobacter flavus]|uniref:sensor histidine kinase n=1 Tax=Chthoniobacter flavus TaxID=191863 RepID=UPI0002F5182F|nr:HAMP domain-containing sensor histidine kinase [Chthoniobacter flavus]
MSSLSPRATLLLLLGLAAVILAGGLRLARTEETIRVDRDREALRRLAGELQLELQRLETLYESHLTRLAQIVKPADAFEVRRAADRIVGVRQFSLLHRDAKDVGGDVHVLIAAAPREHTPVPMFDESSRNRTPGTPVLVSRGTIFGEDANWSGWIEEPGKPLMFWQRVASNEVVVILVDETAVEEAVERWLQAWTESRFAPVRVGGGPDQFRARNGQALLAEGGAQVERPDLLLPLRSRLGTWDLASWDLRETRVHYAVATLATSGVLAVFVASLGVLIFGQQRRAAALAAQRVSFVNRVSHELRTPLTNILLNLDLASEALDDTPRDAERRLGLVQEETRRLGRLIDNVLTFSRHEQGKLRAEAHACVPASVIATVVEQFAPSFARRALEVRRAGDLTAPCLLDTDAFAQILANLFSNVEKYVSGGLVEIGGAWKDDVLTVTVADQGPGIPSESAERIFRPFERLDSRINEGASGTGLGLAIARDLATAMHGTLRLLPSTRGACFELRVAAPRAEPLKSISVA